MNPQEYRARMKKLSDEMRAISEEFYAPILEEYQRRCLLQEKRTDVSKLAREYGATQSILNKRINESNFEKNRRAVIRAAMDAGDVPERIWVI